MKKLRLENNDFYLGEEKFQIISGAIHYFRCHPDDWEDRLLKLKACGFNTVETCIPWNLHEPLEGHFNFTGFGDLERFIQLSRKVGLYLIVRPGPYMCGEWDFGGFPSWIMTKENMELRCMDLNYLKYVDRYFDVLIPKLVKYLPENDGNIIAVQIENEYGSYGCDKEYLEYLKDGLLKRGLDTFFVTSDGSLFSMLTAGRIDGVLSAINFGSDPKKNFEVLNQYFGEYPKFCMEYWLGWFDHWGKEHIHRDVESVTNDIRYMKEQGISFNVYMFYGGTTFGFMNGANYNELEGYQPTTTSYDYDALLSEDGSPTEKYWAIKEILNPDLEISFDDDRIKYEDVNFTQCARLFENLDRLSTPKKSSVPMEMLQGFMLYKTTVTGARESEPIKLIGLHDRAQIFVDGKEEGVYYREDKKIEYVYLEISHRDEKKELSILVENMGRINYGAYLKERKGILRGVFLGDIYGSYIHGFENYELPLDNIGNLSYEPFNFYQEPVFLKGEFHVSEKKNTYFDMRGFKKGVVFLNGFCLGRYWEIGPQRDLYIPKGLLQEGKNELVIFELHSYPERICFSTERIFSEK